MSQTTVETRKSIEKSAAHLELGRQLEAQAGAVVFEARQLDVNRRIHVRAYSLGTSGKGTTPEQIRRTVAKLRSLSHPGLAKIYGGGAADGMAYVETEPVRGMWPKEVAAKRRLSPRQKLELAIQLCETLAYLNSQGIRYGALVPRGVLVQRKLGSLRLEPKLVRYESMRAFKSDGSDQQAFGDFVAAILGPASNNDSDLDHKLRGISSRCATATADSPTFAELLLTLRPLLVEQTAAAASPTIHLAERLRVEVPPPRTKPNNDPQTSRGKVFAAIGIGTFVALLVSIVVVDSYPNLGTAPSEGQLPTRTYRSSPPTARREPSAIQPRSASPRDVSIQRRRLHAGRERTYRFMPSMRHSSVPLSLNPAAAEFARPRTWGPELEEDAIALSKPTWTKGTFGEPELAVAYSCAADLGNNSRILWIIESNGVRQYEARVWPGIPSDVGTIKGEISTVSTGRLESQLTTYLAEDPIGFGEPRRVSNILTLPVPSEE